MASFFTVATNFHATKSHWHVEEQMRCHDFKRAAIAVVVPVRGAYLTVSANLATLDRPTRDKALESLRSYLLSTRDFTEIELLKLWKGLFFTMWHADRPLPQQRLALELSHLILPMPSSLFISFLSAFWITISREWTNIDALRMDKFMRLVRCYVNAAFTYLARASWESELLGQYLQLIERIPLSSTNTKVSDGLRYHVLDIWVEELSLVDKKREGLCPIEDLMDPISKLSIKGKTKKVRERAKECLNDTRLEDWTASTKENQQAADKHLDGTEDEWNGLDD